MQRRDFIQNSIVPSEEDSLYEDYTLIEQV